MSRSTTRRGVLLGGAALGLAAAAGAAAPATAEVPDGELIALGIELDRARRRAGRLRARVRRGEEGAWRKWSDTVGIIETLCSRIGRTPVRSLAGLVVKFEALHWQLVEDGTVMDDGVRRRVSALRRDLRRQLRDIG